MIETEWANAPKKAPNPDAITSVIANFKQVVKDRDLRLHPLITRLVDKETLENMGAKKAAPAGIDATDRES